MLDWEWLGIDTVERPPQRLDWEMCRMGQTQPWFVGHAMLRKRVDPALQSGRHGAQPKISGSGLKLILLSKASQQAQHKARRPCAGG